MRAAMERDAHAAAPYAKASHATLLRCSQPADVYVAERGLSYGESS